MVRSDPPSPVQLFMRLFPKTCERISKVYCWIETKARSVHWSIRHLTFALIAPLVIAMFGPVGIYVAGIIGAIATFAWLATTQSLRQYSIFSRFMISVILNLGSWGILGYVAYKFAPQVPVEEIADRVIERLEKREAKQAKPAPPPMIEAKEQPHVEAIIPKPAEKPQAEKKPPPDIKPESERHRPPPQLSLIFKNSPLFTPVRKERITIEIETFYKYLVQLGLNAPSDIPQLG
jgi:energy-coupling factor transporter transmembrane protein EcfT